VVTALIAGASAVGGALVAASAVLLVIGVVLVLAGLVYATVLARHGTGSLSFTREFPDTTYGPRGTTGGDSSPPIDTHPNGLPGPSEYRTMAEVDAADMAEPPDDRRAFPQLSNLSPDERLRNVDGHEVIERAEGGEGDFGVGDSSRRPDGEHR
jgi:hypothetical protein